MLPPEQAPASRRGEHVTTIPPDLDDIMAAIEERDRGSPGGDIVKWDTRLAVEIKRLRAENATLREFLEDALDWDGMGHLNVPEIWRLEVTEILQALGEEHVP